MNGKLIRLLGVGAVAIVVAIVVAGSALAEQSYPDAQGDAGAGSDITGITVRNDQAGAISIQVGVVNPIVDNHGIIVFVDADKNQATGGAGDEYIMIGGPLVGAIFLSWNGSGFVPTSPPGFGIGSAAANVMEFSVGAGGLGSAGGFNFAVYSASFDVGSAGLEFKAWDAAPESGYFTYDLAFPQCSNAKDDDGDGKIDAQDLGCSGTTDDNEADDPVNIKVGKAKVTPARPKAGRTVVVSAPTTRVETNQALDAATVKCSAKIVGGAALRGTGSLVAGRATCKYKVPATARNKTVRGKIAVTYQTASASTPFTFRTAA